MPSSPFRAVCFDFDYTLADCTDSIVAGFQYAFPKLGWPAPDRETVRGTVGYLLEDSYTRLTGDTDPVRRAAFRPLFLEVAQERQIRETLLFPGAPQLLRRLKECGIRTAIVSTKRGHTIQAILQQHGLLDALDLIIGGEDVTLPKPDPQGLLVAMERLDVRPREFLFCGDTVLDAGAAVRAGCPFCAVLNGTTGAEAFSEYHPLHIAPDLPDLQRWLHL